MRRPASAPGTHLGLRTQDSGLRTQDSGLRTETMNHLARAHQLSESGESFAIATVVRCEPPASARPGAKAIVLANGTIEGWVGGSCAQDLVVREAQRAIETGTSRLLRLSPTV